MPFFESDPLRGLLSALIKGLPTRAALSFFLPVNPVPASRPRVSRWGTYYGKNYKNWIKQAQGLLEDSEVELQGPLLAVVRCVVQKPKTTRLDMPKPDVDNYAKAILDVVTKAEGYWSDDWQVQTLLISKRWTNPAEEPGTYLDIFSYEDS